MAFFMPTSRLPTIVCAAAVTLTVAFLCVNEAAFADDWPVLRGDSHQTGAAAGPLADPLSLKWTASLKARTESSPTIVSETLCIGAENGVLYCLDTRTGKLNWKYETGGGAIKGAPGIKDGRVFIGNYQGVMHAVVLATGAKLWTFKTGNDIISSANFAGNKVIFGSYDHCLYAVDAATGQLQWKFETDAQVHCSPCITDKAVIIAGCDGLLRTIAPDTGVQIEAIDLASNVASAPVFAEGRLYVAAFNGSAICADLSPLRMLWSVSADAQETVPLYASPALAKGCLLIAGRDNLVRGLSADSGKARWTFTTRGKVDSSPVVVGERVFFGSADGTLYEVGLADGKKRWSYPTGAPILSSPAVANGCLYVASQDGVVFCFSASGKER